MGRENDSGITGQIKGLDEADATKRLCHRGRWMMPSAAVPLIALKLD